VGKNRKKESNDESKGNRLRNETEQTRRQKLAGNPGCTCVERKQRPQGVVEKSGEKEEKS